MAAEKDITEEMERRLAMEPGRGEFDGKTYAEMARRDFGGWARTAIKPGHGWDVMTTDEREQIAAYLLKSAVKALAEWEQEVEYRPSYAKEPTRTERNKQAVYNLAVRVYCGCRLSIDSESK